jgi:hypothetical protein
MMVESLFIAVLGSDILMPPPGSMIILVGVCDGRSKLNFTTFKGMSKSLFNKLYVRP